MGTFISVLIMIVCVVLVLVVLVQNSKGGGLTSQFSSSNQVMGVKKTSELIEKITWGLAIALLVLCVSSSFISSSSTTEAKESLLQDKVQNAPAPKPLQNFPVGADKAAPAKAAADSTKK